MLLSILLILYLAATFYDLFLVLHLSATLNNLFLVLHLSATFNKLFLFIHLSTTLNKFFFILHLSTTFHKLFLFLHLCVWIKDWQKIKENWRTKDKNTHIQGLFYSLSKSKRLKIHVKFSFWCWFCAHCLGNSKQFHIQS